jgi:hypothetical protein
MADNDEVESVTLEVLYAHRGWMVEENEDGKFDILDHDGDVTDEADTLEEAIETCHDAAEESYRERLVEAFEDFDWYGMEDDDLADIAIRLGIGHDEADAMTSLEEAIEACRNEAEGSHPRRLVEAIEVCRDQIEAYYHQQLVDAIKDEVDAGLMDPDDLEDLATQLDIDPD